MVWRTYADACVTLRARACVVHVDVEHTHTRKQTAGVMVRARFRVSVWLCVSSGWCRAWCSVWWWWKVTLVDRDRRLTAEWVKPMVCRRVLAVLEWRRRRRYVCDLRDLVHMFGLHLRCDNVSDNWIDCVFGWMRDVQNGDWKNGIRNMEWGLLPITWSSKKFEYYFMFMIWSSSQLENNWIMNCRWIVKTNKLNQQ